VVEFHTAAICGGNCLEPVAVVPVKFGGGLNCKPLLGSVVTDSACVVIMG